VCTRILLFIIHQQVSKLYTYNRAITIDLKIDRKREKKYTSHHEREDIGRMPCIKKLIANFIYEITSMKINNPIPTVFPVKSRSMESKIIQLFSS